MGQSLFFERNAKISKYNNLSNNTVQLDFCNLRKKTIFESCEIVCDG